MDNVIKEFDEKFKYSYGKRFIEYFRDYINKTCDGCEFEDERLAEDLKQFILTKLKERDEELEKWKNAYAGIQEVHKRELKEEFVKGWKDFASSDAVKKEVANGLLEARKEERIKTLEEVKDVIKHKINIHKKIEEMHDQYPKDWHDGNIQFGEDILDLINNLKN